MKSTSSRSILLLMLTSMIWGSAFVAQSVGMDYIGPCTFLALRSYLGGSVLLIYLAITRRRKATAPSPPQRKALVVGGLCCAAALCVASLLQQYGIMYTTVSKSGFLTALYVLIVPFVSLFLFHKRLPGQIWVCVALSLVGLYLLCLSGPVGFTFGDGLTLLCAVAFSVQILFVDHFSPKADPVMLSCIEFFACAIMSTIPALLFEPIDPAAIGSAMGCVAYAGILSSGVGYTLQMVAQRECDPTVCSLAMCMEAVFSALFGWVILGQTLSGRELLGCGLMFAAIILSQLPTGRSRIAGGKSQAGRPV